MLLRDATPSEIDDILGQTHALWSDGLQPDAYRDFIHTLMASEWALQGERNYRFLALVDEGGVAAAMKLYRFAARLDNEPIAVGGIGAVFTPVQRRRRGSAAEMIARAHRIMAERGDVISLLFSEIGAAYYAKLGYREMPSHPVRLKVPADGPPAPAGLERMHRSRLDAVIRLREREDAGAAFTLVRDRAFWKYLLARASYPTLSLGRDGWESRLMVAAEGGYLWSLFGASHEGSAARLLESGESAPGAALPGLLDDLFAECRRRGVAEVDAWLPPAASARDPRLGPPSARPIDPPNAVPMWFPLEAEAGRDMALHAGAAVFQLTDIF